MLVIFAGLHLLWQARREVYFWLGRFVEIFRARLEQPHARPFRAAPGRPVMTRERTLRMALALSLLLFVGPILIVLGFTL